MMGQLFHLFEAPNRFGLPAFYTLHVWAWKDNPQRRVRELASARLLRIVRGPKQVIPINSAARRGATTPRVQAGPEVEGEAS